MIDLTPLEVRKKKGDFKRSMRGYDAELVDDFLDLVADRLEELVRENLGHIERLARLEQQVKDFREREKALTDALVTAQEYREESHRQAARDADLLRREAEAAAEDILARAHTAREKEEEALRRVRARRGHLIQSFRVFLERELAELSVQEDSLELEAQAEAEAGQPWERRAHRRAEPDRGGEPRRFGFGMERRARPPTDVISGALEEDEEEVEPLEGLQHLEDIEEIASVLEFAPADDETVGVAEGEADEADEADAADDGLAAAGGPDSGAEVGPRPAGALMRNPPTFSLLEGEAEVGGVAEEDR